MRKFAKVAVGALLVAGATTATTAAMTSPAEARVAVGFSIGGPGYYGYFGPSYYPAYPYPAYYGGYYGPRPYPYYYGRPYWRGYGPGWHRGYYRGYRHW